MRKYKPFLIYNPNRGWAFYPNRSVSPLTVKTIGTNRKVMRGQIGWFHTAALAAMFERNFNRQPFKVT